MAARIVSLDVMPSVQDISTGNLRYMLKEKHSTSKTRKSTQLNRGTTDDHILTSKKQGLEQHREKRDTEDCEEVLEEEKRRGTIGG